MKRIKIQFIVTLLAFVLTLPALAQVGVGKLSGKVTDEATGEALVGANVVITNTQLGAATNIDGEYFILNITPGTYEIKASYVGFASRTIQEVRIVAGITYELNITLTTDFTVPEVIVEDKKFFEAKATNTTKVFDADQISRLPVKGVQNIASLNAGVAISDGSGGASGNANLNVRGGRGGEVLYIIDGVPQNDIYTGGNYGQVSNSAIEQLSFQIGGYEAKYGQAQSGVINVTTKSGSPNYAFYADALTSSFTDDYGYNLYTMNLSGPWIPGQGEHTFFFSGERGWNSDDDPRAVGVSFESIKKSASTLPDNSSGIWRFTGRSSHRFGDFSLRLGTNVNAREGRNYVHTYSKQNSLHNPRFEESNLSFNARISQNVSSSSFWNLSVGYKMYQQESGDGYWFDNVLAYGDSALNAARGVTLPTNGVRVTFDDYGIFAKYGRVSNGYTRYANNTINVDFDFTSQVQNHLFEIGGGFSHNTVRSYGIAPVALASNSIRNLPLAERYARLQPDVFGYDITGTNETSAGDQYEPKVPITAFAYIQDRFELSDMVLNIGIRMDYLDTKADILKNPALPFGYGDPLKFDDADFVVKDPEIYLSPRIGLGFPVTESTVFHAQYGKFIQNPQLDQLYTSVSALESLLSDANLGVNSGYVESEITTQYEVGFRQAIEDIAALNITAFYKNTQGLINSTQVQFSRQEGGQVFQYIAPTNTDFGTIKGLALSLDVTQISYFGISADYTYSIAEGTGSSTSSSFTAAFRNTFGDVPKVIAPLDFDQRHTGVINVDFFVPKDELGFLELTNANLLFRFSSGRPYTPVAEQDLVAGASNYGETKGYVNSAYGPSNLRVDFRIEKTFAFGDAFITPYAIIENLLDSDNIVNVYRSTGDPYSTGFLQTEKGRNTAESNFIRTGTRGWEQDYKSLERNPFNFGIPRLIKVGLKVNFSKISF